MVGDLGRNHELIHRGHGLAVEELESAVAAMDEVVEARRLFGSPDYILRVLVTDVAAYERFRTTKLLVLPGVSRTISHQTMKLIKRDL